MNMKELEKAYQELVDEVMGLKSDISTLMRRYEEMGVRLEASEADLRAARATCDDLKTALNDLRASHVAQSELIEDLRAKVEGRNKSAAVKRNMTDADALRVLNGDLVKSAHKEAAETLGLTYAQVYSCRLGFTFKHVIHELEKTGWRSQWAKG